MPVDLKLKAFFVLEADQKTGYGTSLRANFSGVPLKIIDQKETTVLGASLFVQAACGNASSPEEARSAIDYKINNSC